MDKRTWDKRALNAVEINAKIEELETQIRAFELLVRYEEKLAAFRDIYMEWYDGRLTLAALLQAMMDRSICKRINPFATDEE